MTTLKYNFKDYNNRKRFIKIEQKRLLLKVIFKQLYLIKQRNTKNLLIYKLILDNIHNNLQKKLKSTYITKCNNRCIITGTSRGVFRKFRLCRTMLRKILLTNTILRYYKI